jgi:hypothetical protein
MAYVCETAEVAPLFAQRGIRLENRERQGIAGLASRDQERPA